MNLVTDQAEAVLSILAKQEANQPLDDGDWQRVFQSEGYVRLKTRETSMNRSFEDSDFRTFVLSEQLRKRAQRLSETLANWKRADITQASVKALAYLPAHARLRAKIYPVIKPRENSFVFEVKTNPAIFLYLDPLKSKDKFANELAHELHHIGYGSACPASQTTDEISRLPETQQAAIKWLGAFGEGFAMLAAAGGPDIHPHAVSSADERARWDKDIENFNSDLKTVEQFLQNILDDQLSQDEIQKQGFSFFGVQGPWYTVGWKMSTVIEKAFGRQKLLECMCDQRLLLPAYNNAAANHNRRAIQPLALWSQSLSNRIGQDP